MIFDELDSFDSQKTKILVIGVGGAGKNAVDHMIENNVRGVEFYAVNTDALDLKVCKAPKRLLIGKTKTHGQGAGACPEVGRAAAIESEDDIHEMIGEAQMVFITCGMGGGTGTGAAPVIAKIAREHGCLTVGICTKPFAFEGPQRFANAVAGLEELRQYVDTLIVIPNQRLLQIVDVNTTVLDAFREADNVLRKAVQGIAEIITNPGLINVDFSDVKHVMADKGTALMGIGIATGPNRAVEAARKAIHSQLLEVTIDGATDAIVNITASQKLTLKEVNAAVEEIRNNAGANLDIIFGDAINSALGDEIVVTVIATGYELKAKEMGYEDIANKIFENISDDDIHLDYVDDDDDDLDSDDMDDEDSKLGGIFATKESKRDKKRREKEERKLQKIQEKEQDKKLEKKHDDDEENKPRKGLPSFLHR